MGIETIVTEIKKTTKRLKTRIDGAEEGVRNWKIDLKKLLRNHHRDKMR